jgi:NitT/TauT family transport system permease protein
MLLHVAHPGVPPDMEGMDAVMLGILIAMLLGVVLSLITSHVSFLRQLFLPLMTVIKATPVASFTLLVFLWLDSSALSTFVSFIMVLPVIYFAVYEGIGSADAKLLEMAKVFCVGKIKTARQIYLPAVAPFLVSAVSVALGFAWKSGIAAEIICISSGTIGNMLYDAKLLLASEDIFAWTAVVIIISKLMEVLSVKLIGRFEKAVTK